MFNIFRLTLTIMIILILKACYFHNSYENAQARHTDSHLSVINIQGSIVLKIIMKRFSQICFQDDYLTNSQCLFCTKVNVHFGIHAVTIHHSLCVVLVVHEYLNDITCFLKINFNFLQTMHVYMFQFKIFKINAKNYDNTSLAWYKFSVSKFGLID